MGEAIRCRPHRELTTRLLRTLVSGRWLTERDIILRDRLFLGMYVDLLLFHQQEEGRIERREGPVGKPEFRLTPAGVLRLADG